MRTPLRTALAALWMTGAACTTPWSTAAEPPAAAADVDAAAALAPELAQLREQVAQLRGTLERLDQKLRQMQLAAAAAGSTRAPVAGVAAPAAGAAPAPARGADAAPGTNGPQPASADLVGPALDAHQQSVLQEQVRTADALEAWRGLHDGMSQAEVRRLLGEPQSTLTVGNRTGWIYAYRNLGKGSVFFGSDGAVVSLMNPNQGAVRLY